MWRIGGEDLRDALILIAGMITERTLNKYEQINRLHDALLAISCVLPFAYLVFVFRYVLLLAGPCELYSPKVREPFMLGQQPGQQGAFCTCFKKMCCYLLVYYVSCSSVVLAVSYKMNERL
jgi:hypothetical protein